MRVLGLTPPYFLGLWVGIPLFIGTGCGSLSNHVATKIRPQIIFSKETVRVSFVLAEGFKTDSQHQTSFGNLGSVFLSFNAEKKESSFGAQMIASPSVLNDSQPGMAFTQFPGGHVLVRLFRAAPLKIWYQESSETQTALIYSPTTRLMVGGMISSSHFRLLRPGYFATQVFREANRDITGTIAIVGPQKSPSGFQGGIFFLADYGRNPFQNNVNHFRPLSEEWQDALQ